jgi:type VI secretion system protein ImpE
MDTKELIRAGRLQEARARAAEEVKSFPSDTARRTLLFQILAFCGEWDKAERHLDILEQQDPRVETGAQVYRNLMAAERKREEVFQGKARPDRMSRMPEWLEELFLAREKLAAGEAEEAAAILRKIDGQTPSLSGVADGKPFKGFRDADDFLAHFLEVFIHDSYLWFPFDALLEITVSAPKSQIDLLWTPARIASKDGLAAGCYLPALYPGAHGSGDDRIRLGRITAWREPGGGITLAEGQHLFLAGREEKALLETREIVFHDGKKGEV